MSGFFYLISSAESRAEVTKRWIDFQKLDKNRGDCSPRGPNRHIGLCSICDKMKIKMLTRCDQKLIAALVLSP